MRKLLILTSCLLHGMLFAQTKPIDTTYYANHSVKSILFESDFSITGSNLLRYYRMSTSKKNIGEKKIDSIFIHQPDWPHPKNISELNRNLFSFSRIFFYSGIIIEERPSVKNKVSYEKVLIDKNFLCLHRNFRNDSLIDIQLSYVDSIKLTNIKSVFYQKYTNGVNPTSLECLIEDKYYIELLFFENGNLKNIIFKLKKSKAWDGKYVRFESTGNVTEVGYYKNGLKNGNWNYYNENIDLVKKEVWKNGKMIK